MSFEVVVFVNCREDTKLGGTFSFYKDALDLFRAYDSPDSPEIIPSLYFMGEDVSPKLLWKESEEFEKNFNRWFGDTADGDEWKRG